MASGIYTVRAGTKDWTFRARQREDAERVIALFDAIGFRYGTDELIGHALAVFQDAGLNSAKKIIELTERRFGERLGRPSQEAFTAVLAHYGYDLSGSSLREQRQQDLAAATTAFESARGYGDPKRELAALYALKRAEDALND